MSESVTLADIERLCWRKSGYQLDQRFVDELLVAVTAYAGYGAGVEPHGEGASALPLAEEDAHGYAADLVITDETQAVRPAEPPVAPPVTAEPAEAVTAPQAGVQRVELTGTLTLVCTPPCAAPHKPAKGVPAPRVEVPVDTGSTVPQGARKCRKCPKVYPLEHYARDPHSPQGRRTACRDCENKRKREARLVRGGGVR